MSEMSQAEVWESLSEGDLIQWDGGTKNPHKVVGDSPDEIDGGGAILMVEGPGGASKLMTQNKHNPDSISVMSMGSMSDSGTWIQNLRVVGSES